MAARAPTPEDPIRGACTPGPARRAEAGLRRPPPGSSPGSFQKPQNPRTWFTSALCSGAPCTPEGLWSCQTISHATTPYCTLEPPRLALPQPRITGENISTGLSSCSGTLPACGLKTNILPQLLGVFDVAVGSGDLAGWGLKPRGYQSLWRWRQT